MKLALRALLVAAVTVVATQPSAAATAPKPLVTTPNSVVFWTPTDGLLGVGVAPRRGTPAERARSS